MLSEPVATVVVPLKVFAPSSAQMPFAPGVPPMMRLVAPVLLSPSAGVNVLGFITALSSFKLRAPLPVNAMAPVLVKLL